jgi:hypothetical protein
MMMTFPIRTLTEAQEGMRLSPRKNRLIAYAIAMRTPAVDILFADQSDAPRIVRLFDLMSESDRLCLGVGRAFAEGQSDRNMMAAMCNSAKGTAARLNMVYNFSTGATFAEDFGVQLASKMGQVVAGVTTWQAPTAARATMEAAWSYGRLSWQGFGRIKGDDWHKPLAWSRRVRDSKMDRSEFMLGVILDIAPPEVGMWHKDVFNRDLVGLAEAAVEADHDEQSMAILGDAVEDYLADSHPLGEAALEVCRSGTPHYEGNWVTDMLRGVA